MSFFYSDDPVMDAERHIEAQDEKLKKLPVCSECEQPIQDDHFYDINGEPVCHDCLNIYYRKEVEDYIE